MSKNLLLAFSPCPNDTFMFHAWVNDLIPTHGLKTTLMIADIEQLNQSALRQQPDIVKLSLGAYAHVSENYELLSSGAALGKNCGPLLVSKRNYRWEDISSLRIAIPGTYTTANLLLTLFKPEANQKQEMLFSDIEEAVLNDTVDAGLLIHENRFTYHDRGLIKIADMGELWESTYHCPLPLGCIAVRKSLPVETKLFLNNLMQQSVSYALQHPDESMPFVRQHAQAMDENIMRQHIQLYVNNWSVQLGDTGKEAIRQILSAGITAGLLPPSPISFTDESNLITLH
jgi:1,4-dihydroxy-6-naphthoate synthase